ncbi:MAG TPA: AmmeMemoRadiSam system protein A [Blastocatellia bacterium]|nr:AmmeMemoRadiSam system protein A [Blastocatellia bacterium]
MEYAPNEIDPPALARLTVEEFIRGGRVIQPPVEPAGVLASYAPVFVTLRIDGSELRGCIGTMSPTRRNVAEEIISNAIRAATHDPRFSPVVADELPRLSYGVDVLHPSEPARGIEDLDPADYGVSVETLDGHLRGVLLPGIEGIDTPEEQWALVHRKAGIRVGTPVKVERFRVSRFGKD